MKFAALLLTLCLVLTGCSWMDGSYVHITHHQDDTPAAQESSATVSSYGQLQDEIRRMVENGIEKNVIFVSNYARPHAETGMDTIQNKYIRDDPLCAYAVERLDYEIGSNSGKPAIAVSISYRHTPSEIRQVRRYQDNEGAMRAVGNALEEVRPGIVILVRQFQDMDFIQAVNDYCLEHPQTVMETPQVTETLYGRGQSRLVELNFTYQTSRDSLREMRQQVEPVFEAAKLYVSDGATSYQKYSQLYSFLMERFDYRIQASITPSYSLLHHGVGDSRAFAVIYAAMCRSVDLPCSVMTGTRDGEPWTWNIIHTGSGRFSHVDLLRCSENGMFSMVSSEDMAGYVWDYSAVPGASIGMIPQRQEAEAAEIPTDPAETETVKK